MNYRLKKITEYTAMLLIWVGLVLLFGMLSEGFLSARIFLALANRIPALAVIAAGMTLVLVIGGIDLSVGSVLGLCSSMLGMAMIDHHLPFWMASVVALLVGLVAGSLNG